jgi:prepilin-type N-terminal cleavage/methylation domain-containing protein
MISSQFNGILIKSSSHSRKNMHNRGFTLIELIISMSIMALLLSLITINLASSSSKASLQSTIALLITDLKQQQIKAMVGDTENSGTAASYGVFFDSSEYVLFKGSSYDANDENNFHISYGDGVVLDTVTFPNNSVIFSRIDGEVIGYGANTNAISLLQTGSQESRTLEINKIGVIDEVE